jgi:hypothetical protein
MGINPIKEVARGKIREELPYIKWNVSLSLS